MSYRKRKPRRSVRPSPVRPVSPDQAPPPQTPLPRAQPIGQPVQPVRAVEQPAAGNPLPEVAAGPRISTRGTSSVAGQYRRRRRAGVMATIGVICSTLFFGTCRAVRYALRELPHRAPHTRQYDDQEGRREPPVVYELRPGGPSELSPEAQKQFDALFVYDEGLEAYDREDYRAATSKFSKVIQLDPNDPRGYYMRGLCYREAEQHDLAARDAAKAIQLNPNDPKYYLLRGLSYYKMERHDQAIPDFSKTVQLDPNDAQCYLLRGKCYYKTAQYEQAISDFSEAIRLNPRYAQAYGYRGNAHRSLGDKEQAEADWAKAEELGAGAPE